MEMHPEDIKSLELAVRLLEYPTFAARLSKIIGMPVEKALVLMPESLGRSLSVVTENALKRSLEAAVRTLSPQARRPAREWRHRIYTAASGGVGGLFGFPALAVELPITTTLILRSIADIARSEGENIRTPEAKLSCVEVFALGSGQEEGGVEAGYFAVRAALAKSLNDVAKIAAATGVLDGTSPLVLRIVARIAARYGLFVSQKAAAQAVPIAGAVGAGAINVVFTAHFQNMARGHFVVRRLERSYGKDAAREGYARALERMKEKRRGPGYKR
jgi:hypothetical protein